MNIRPYSSFAKLSFGISTLAVAAFASSQTYFNGNHNIIVPKSGIQRPGAMRTHYLILNSPNNVAAIARRAISIPSFGPQAEGGIGYTPRDILAAYNIPAGMGTGAIAVVDAFNLASALTDFNTFSKQYNLPTESSAVSTATTNKVFQVVGPNGPGNTTLPSGSAVTSGWGGEIALDIEWAHSMAPAAKIYLVEATDNLGDDLYTAAQMAASLPGVKEVSMSFGGGESPSELSQDSTFQTHGVVFFASSGDSGGAQEYPSESPYVVGVGGTSLNVRGYQYFGETAWNGSGGGPSSVEPRPFFQDPIQNIVGNFRGTPDISAVADPETGVWVYSSTAFGTSTTSDWAVIGGTSLACPVSAAITNDRGTWTLSTQREEQRIYFNLGGVYYHDIVSGFAGGFAATRGWDYITGIGTPKGLFPAFVAPETLTARQCQVYQNGTPNIPTTKESSILAAVASLDNVMYSVNSVNSASGQTSDIVLNFTMDQSLTRLTAAVVNVVGKAPAGTTLQIYGYNPTTKQYVYTGQSVPATGATQTLSFSLSSTYIATNGAVSLIVRTLRPPHISTLPYTYSVDEVNLFEETTQPWDVSAPL